MSRSRCHAAGSRHTFTEAGAQVVWLQAVRKHNPALRPEQPRLLAPYFPKPGPDRPGNRAGASPEPRRSTSVQGTEVLRRGSGEAMVRGW